MRHAFGRTSCRKDGEEMTGKNPEEVGKDLSFDGQGIEDGKETSEAQEYREIG